MTHADLEDRCTTLHPVFHDVCLNRWVLEIASLAPKTKPGRFLAKVARVNQSQLFVATVLIHDIPCFVAEYTYLELTA